MSTEPPGLRPASQESAGAAPSISSCRDGRLSLSRRHRMSAASNKKGKKGRGPSSTRAKSAVTAEAAEATKDEVERSDGAEAADNAERPSTTPPSSGDGPGEAPYRGSQPGGRAKKEQASIWQRA